MTDTIAQSISKNKLYILFWGTIDWWNNLSQSHSPTSESNLPIVASLDANSGELHKCLSPACEEGILALGEGFYFSPRSGITHKNWVGLQESLVGQQIAVILVVEQERGHWIVGRTSFITCTRGALLGELLCVALLQSTVYGHQASVLALLEPIAEWVAVRCTDAMCAYHIEEDLCVSWLGVCALLGFRMKQWSTAIIQFMLSLLENSDFDDETLKNFQQINVCNISNLRWPIFSKFAICNKAIYYGDTWKDYKVIHGQSFGGEALSQLVNWKGCVHHVWPNIIGWWDKSIPSSQRNLNWRPSCLLTPSNFPLNNQPLGMANDEDI